jgi:hypothetical protein
VGPQYGKPYLHVFTLKKIFLSGTSRPISMKLGINSSYLMGILNCSDKGPGPFQRGDNFKNANVV